jgi:hypothetical protein
MSSPYSVLVDELAQVATRTGVKLSTEYTSPLCQVDTTGEHTSLGNPLKKPLPSQLHLQYVDVFGVTYSISRIFRVSHVTV